MDPGTNVSVNEMDMTLNNTARILVQEGSSHTRDAQTPFYQTETQQNQARQEPKVCPLVMLNGDVHVYATLLQRCQL